MMNANNIFISIVIPVYNEEKRVQSFLFSVIEYLRGRDFSYEVIIADDGSIDGTIAITEALLKARLPDKYRILRLPQNKGKGAAIKSGMLEAAGEHICFLDADGSTSIQELDNFIPRFDPDHDLYIATRTIKHKAPLKRKFFGYGYIYLANLLLGLRVADITCGFKCYTRKSARTIFPLQTINNWSFDAEDIFIARKFGYNIKQIPVKWQHVGESKVKVFKNVVICAFDLLRIRIHDSRGLYS